MQPNSRTHARWMAVVSVLAVLGATAEGAPGPASRKRTVELRSYNLKPGTRDAFHRLVTEVGIPMSRRFDIDVVACGPSTHDDTSYYLVRAFADPADRKRKEDAFYGDKEWDDRLGDRVMSLIDTYTTVVLELDEGVVEGLRRNGR